MGWEESGQVHGIEWFLGGQSGCAVNIELLPAPNPSWQTAQPGKGALSASLFPLQAGPSRSAAVPGVGEAGADLCT